VESAMNLPERILKKRCFPRKRHIVRALVAKT
jgi:hypothetical protein